MKLLLIIIFTISCLTSSKAQFIVNGGAGLTNFHFTGELQAGYKFKWITLSTGYTSLVSSNQPIIFNTRLGVVMLKKFHLYTGYSRVTYSTDDRRKNYNDWQIGGQYFLCEYKDLSVYTGFMYTSKFYTTSIGMALNLF